QLADAQIVLAARPGLFLHAAAEQAEAVAPAAGAGGVGGAHPGGEGGGLAGVGPGLHLPGRSAAGHGLILLGGADLALAHAGVEIPALVVLAGVTLAEIIEVVEPLARLGRARRRGLTTVGPVARLLAGLEVQDVGLRRLLFGAG